ncbi:MAG TPA: hypothetical protein VMQ93_01610 [Novosphingobium sp.]|nr:hypothetical protein [Novosphingobium sp.]
MIDQAAPPAIPDRVETTLREELARGDVMAGTAVPILRQLIAAGDLSIFSEEVVARLRGMLADIARQLLDALVGGQGSRAHSAGEVEVVGHALLDNPALVAHLHALTLEWQLTERLQARLGLDAAASPLVQGLIASPDERLRADAAAFLAAQVRWCQSQRRMSLPLRELPADLLNVALYTLRTLAGVEPVLAERATVVESEIRRSYDEANTRAGMAARLMAGLAERGGLDVPAVAHSGVPLFVEALARASGQARDTVLMSTHRSQIARLALTLRASGLAAEAAQAQVLSLHPETVLPDVFAAIDETRAAAILASSRAVLRPHRP